MLTTIELLKNTENFIREANKEPDGITDTGLWNGHTGMAIVYYLLARHSADASFAEKGLQLLDSVSETGVPGGDLSFANGLTGVGWAIEWLAQNELMEDINTDEVLEPIDSMLYNAVCYSRDENPSLSHGTLGKIAYFIQRAQSRNAATNRYKTIGHLECLILSLDDLAEKTADALTIPDQQDSNANNRRMHLCNLAEILYIISGIKVQVNSPVTGKLMYDAINYAEYILSGSVMNDERAARQPDEWLDLLYVATSYLIAARLNNNKFWESQAADYIARIIPFADDNSGLTTEQQFQKLVLFSLLNFYHPAQQYRIVIEDLLTHLSFLELPPALLNGYGTLAIVELCLLNPGLIDNWYEVMFFSRQPYKRDPQ
ncbi:lanthionine synthetase LanC family protein [Longitalea arenae]|uniref:lanthionine synthetase LanC family protein n=1 Tax=Longitalea arenae TaxID=2812558 RepID=UPI00196793CF|nr:lanthionine synthetase LanC family protein [Longitalea arenae]